MINFERLYYFQQIAKNESIRKASQDLYVSESALSKSLRLLEQEMGCPLFQRNGKRLRLSDEGLFLLHQVDDLIKRAEELKPKLERYRGIYGQIVMNTFFDFPVKIMMSDVLEKSFPDTRFIWKNTNMDTCEHIRELEERITDIAIIPVKLDTVQKIMPKLGKNGINSMFLVMERLHLSAPKGTALDETDSMTVLDTRKERLIKPRGNLNYTNDWYEEILAANRTTPIYQYEVDPHTFLKDWEKCPYSFITTSFYISHKDYSSGFAQRHQIRLTDQEAERGIFLFYRNEKSQIIDLFTETFKQKYYEVFIGGKADTEE